MAWIKVYFLYVPSQRSCIGSILKSAMLVMLVKSSLRCSWQQASKQIGDREEEKKVRPFAPASQLRKVKGQQTWSNIVKFTGSRGDVFAVMHLSMVCPRTGGPGNPRELDFVKRTWVGILTSTKVPRVGNLTQPPSWKAERTWEWVTGPPSWKIPRSHLCEFPASKDGWKKGKECRVAFFKAKTLFFMPISALSLTF